MIQKSSIFLAVLFFCCTALKGSSLASARRAAWQDKVDPWVLSTMAARETEFLIFLREQADLRAANGLDTRLAKGRFVFEMLSEVAARTQKPVLEELDALGAAHRSYWVANMIWVRGGSAVIQAMAERTDVAHIFANPTVALQRPQTSSGATAHAAIEWNIALVKAPQVWSAGVTGQGVVIGGQDTGYEWQHPALINQYRGWQGGSADHNYHWHDAIHSGGGICGPDSPEPCDDFGHGTHTMGTMVGDDGGANQVGMAPGARWIGCRNMDVGNGTPATYSECFQWFIAPTDLAGQNPDPSMAPDVINNSWSCPPSEGCTDPGALHTVVENTRAAGILVVVSAGNSGPTCESVDTPAAIYQASFTVGSTTMADMISGFSSRGPVTVDGSGRMKPNISAPGSIVRSTIPGGGYATMSGTSMAAPHVAGLAGLLIAADPALAGQVDALEDAIEQSALPRATADGCGGDTTTQVPNNTYGWGRIDAWAAVSAVRPDALELTKRASATIIEPGELLTYTLRVTHTQGLSLTHQVVLSDVIPLNSSFVTATVPHSYEAGSGTVVWQHPQLAVGEGISRTLVVQILPDAVDEVINQTYLASSDEVDPVFGSAVFTPIELRYGVMLAGSFDVLAPPGSGLALIHPLSNTGNVQDTYSLTHTSSLDWTIQLPDSLTVWAGQTISVTMQVSVPISAAWGTSNTITVTAISMTDPLQQDSAFDRVTAGIDPVSRWYFPVIRKE